MVRQFEFKKTTMEGLILISPFYQEDERGFFMKSYEKEIYEKNGIFLNDTEDFSSKSNKGVLRGLHFQTKNSQDKLVSVVAGEVWDVVVDLRYGSDTFGKWQGFYLSEKNHFSLYIPKQFAHGFLALEDNTIITYKCGDFYDKETDTGIMWNDPDINIKWPLEKTDKLIISDRDWKHQSFAEFKGKML